MVVIIWSNRKIILQETSFFLFFFFLYDFSNHVHQPPFRGMTSDASTARAFAVCLCFPGICRQLNTNSRFTVTKDSMVCLACSFLWMPVLRSTESPFCWLCSVSLLTVTACGLQTLSCKPVSAHVYIRTPRQSYWKSCSLHSRGKPLPKAAGKQGCWRSLQRPWGRVSRQTVTLAALQSLCPTRSQVDRESCPAGCAQPSVRLGMGRLGSSRGLVAVTSATVALSPDSLACQSLRSGFSVTCPFCSCSHCPSLGHFRLEALSIQHMSKSVLIVFS